MTTLSKIEKAFATDVWFADSKLHVRLEDGREIGVPIDWFPKLRDASDAKRENWRLIGKKVKAFIGKTSMKIFR